MKLIAQGAEAKIFKADNTIIKERPPKKYRIKQIDDELRKTRTRKEAKILERLQQEKFNSPKIISFCDKEMKIEMECINGELMKNKITQNPEKYGKEIGKIIGKLHSKDIIHQDLTTSNIMIKKGKIYLIDFGLSFFSNKEEDKAVDLHLLEKAMQSKHPEICSKAIKKAQKFLKDLKK